MSIELPSDLELTVPDNKNSVSIVVPVFNEEQVLPEFHSRLSAVLDQLGAVSEIIYIDDGSTDETVKVLNGFRASDPRVSVLRLSRNFGKEIALTAGLDLVRCDAAVLIDADLQDPPELISELVANWREGYDVVYARRTSRDGEGIIKRGTAAAFYRLMQHIGGRVTIPPNTGDFRLLSNKALGALSQFREQHRFMKGLFAWIGYPQKEVLYARHPRAAGKTKWNFRGLWNLSIEGITSFTIAPLKVATYLGLVAATGAFSYGIYFLVLTLIQGNPVPGYPSLLIIVLFLGGIQLLAIGILGEYLGRVFNETKNRPLYLVREFLPSRLAGFDRPADRREIDSNRREADLPNPGSR